jgi:hypothetical protein
VLDPAIRTLLSGPLDSFEKLEIAVALVRAPGRALSMVELARTTPLSSEQIRRGVEDLQVAKLANAAGGLVRLVVRPSEDAAYQALADLHRRDPSAIAVAMTELSLEKLRGMTAHAFAEAFQTVRKKDET